MKDLEAKLSTEISKGEDSEKRFQQEVSLLLSFFCYPRISSNSDFFQFIPSYFGNKSTLHIPKLNYYKGNLFATGYIEGIFSPYGLNRHFARFGMSFWSFNFHNHSRFLHETRTSQVWHQIFAGSRMIWNKLKARLYSMFCSEFWII